MKRKWGIAIDRSHSLGILLSFCFEQGTKHFPQVREREGRNEGVGERRLRILLYSDHEQLVAMQQTHLGEKERYCPEPHTKGLQQCDISQKLAWMEHKKLIGWGHN